MGTWVGTGDAGSRIATSGIVEVSHMGMRGRE